MANAKCEVSDCEVVSDPLDTYEEAHKKIVRHYEVHKIQELRRIAAALESRGQGSQGTGMPKKVESTATPRGTGDATGVSEGNRRPRSAATGGQ